MATYVLFFVMPGLDPGIHASLHPPEVVDGRVKPGHDGEGALGKGDRDGSDAFL
jgi:hypothetical protein